VEPLTNRLLRRPGESSTFTRRSPSARSRADPGADLAQYAGHWVALLDERVVADDETPAGLMRKVWESQVPLDDVRVQFVEASGPATMVS
jgi:Family of unknown function (DUF5678)